MKPTEKQGQYLAFIYYYTKINGIAPAESDFIRYFKVTPPSVHQMIVTLERNNFIERTPGKGRSITLRIKRAEIPELE
jgi:Mn-dependent DtxR family transcriptional regulator